MPRCPHCEALITHLNYQANYSETSYGTTSGTASLDMDDHEIQDQECDGSDNWEEYDRVYKCPECEEEIEDAEDLLPDEPVKKKKVKKFTTNTLGDFPKKVV